MRFKEFMHKLVFPFDDIFHPSEDCSVDEGDQGNSSIQTIYFVNGYLEKVVGKYTDYWYDADILVSDGKTFDLHSYSEIRSIPIPKFNSLSILSDGPGITGSLEYVLRMKAGTHFNRKEKELCSACLWKSTEMMVSLGFRWRKQDLQRLINWHVELGMLDEAEKAKRWLSSFPIYTENSFDIYAKSFRDNSFSRAKEFNTDLVAFQDLGSVSSCCAICAAHRGRVYSISGKSKDFPPLPQYAKEHGNFHPGCRCSMSVYLPSLGLKFRGKDVDPKKSSWRTWQDDRTDREKELYNNYLSDLQKKDAEERRYASDKMSYARILKALPQDAPASFSAFRRIKYSDSTKYTELKEKALKIGIKI